MLISEAEKEGGAAAREAEEQEKQKEEVREVDHYHHHSEVPKYKLVRCWICSPATWERMPKNVSAKKKWNKVMSTSVRFILKTEENDLSRNNSANVSD